MIVSLDLETTGLDPFLPHGVIQLGLAFYQDSQIRSFCMDVNSSSVRDPEAMAINGFTDERISKAAHPYYVEGDALAFLGNPKERSLTALGWNVGSFDLVFLRTLMPRLFSVFSHRCLELNSFASAVSLATGTDLPVLKVDSKVFAANILAEPVMWHDAGYDSKAALVTYTYFSSLLKARAPAVVPRQVEKIRAGEVDAILERGWPEPKW